MARTTREDRNLKIRIFKEFYGRNARFPMVFEDIGPNELNITGNGLYHFISRLVRAGDIDEISEELKAEVKKVLKNASGLYWKLLTDEDKARMLGKRDQSQLTRFLDALLTSKLHRKDTLEVLKESGVRNPKDFFQKIGYDFKEDLTPAQNNALINFENTPSLTEESTQDDLFRVFLNDNFAKLSEDEIEGEVEYFLNDLFDFEKTEINGWFVEVIKNDFEEVRKMIREAAAGGAKSPKLAVQKGIFELVNQRGLMIDNGVAVEPFRNLDEMKGFASFEFSKSNRGMPDILYFPKDSTKDVVSSSMSSWDNPNHSYSIFHHFYKVSRINSLVSGKITSRSNVVELVNDDVFLLGGIVDISKQNMDSSFRGIQSDLGSKTLDEIFDTEKMSFGAAIKSSSLTVYQQRKDFKAKDENNAEKISSLREVEEINTLMFFLSLVGAENLRFSEKSAGGDIEADVSNNRIIEGIFEKISVGILSSKGFYTETSKNVVADSARAFLEYLTNPDTLRLFERSNRLKGGYSDNFKQFAHKAVSYINTYYSDMLVEYQERTNFLFDNDLFRYCLSERKAVSEKIYDKRRNKLVDFMIGLDDPSRMKAVSELVKSNRGFEATNVIFESLVAEDGGDTGMSIDEVKKRLSKISLGLGTEMGARK